MIKSVHVNPYARCLTYYGKDCNKSWFATLYHTDVIQYTSVLLLHVPKRSLQPLPLKTRIKVWCSHFTDSHTIRRKAPIFLFLYRRPLKPYRAAVRRNIYSKFDPLTKVQAHSLSLVNM